MIEFRLDLDRMPDDPDSFTESSELFTTTIVEKVRYDVVGAETVYWLLTFSQDVSVKTLAQLLTYALVNLFRRLAGSKNPQEPDSSETHYSVKELRALVKLGLTEYEHTRTAKRAQFESTQHIRLRFLGNDQINDVAMKLTQAQLSEIESAVAEAIAKITT